MEQAPSLEDDADDVELPIRKIEGYGFEALGDALVSERHGIYRPLQEFRPLYLVTHYQEELTGMDSFIKDLVISRFDLARPEQERIESLYAERFDERLANRIIYDYSRPIILPLALGEGSQPPWRVGPIWMLYSKLNYLAFRDQLERLKFER